jgi:hypothetical protein
MRKLLLAVVAATAAISWQASSHADTDELYVVVNKANPVSSMSQEDLRPLFQTTKSQWNDGVKADPINLLDDDPARQQFDQAVLGLDPDRVARYWIDRKIRGGERPPRKLASASAAARSVGNERGAVAYVHRSDLTPSIKIVAKIANGKVVSP